jgi:pantoate--beta-alanine ligase
METVTTIAAVRERVRGWHREGRRVAFVPTMGNLHPGHVSLIEAARRHGERFVASIFVNPMQFGPNEDFAHYPRTPQQDARMLAAAGCNLMFMPEVNEIYPHGAERATRVEVPGIRRMVAELCMPVEIIAAPTARDADGLAMSSRNQYLTAEERARAPKIYAALQEAANRVRSGDADFASIERSGLQALERAGLRPEYFAVRQAADLGAPAPGARELVVLTAARLGKARLIDNVQVSRS